MKFQTWILVCCVLLKVLNCEQNVDRDIETKNGSIKTENKLKLIIGTGEKSQATVNLSSEVEPHFNEIQNLRLQVTECQSSIKDLKHHIDVLRSASSSLKGKSSEIKDCAPAPSSIQQNSCRNTQTVEKIIEKLLSEVFDKVGTWSEFLANILTRFCNIENFYF